jgi:hypothetical protein
MFKPTKPLPTKQEHISRVKASITPTVSLLLDNYHEVSEDSLKRSELKLEVLKTITNRMDIDGREAVEAENYCKLLKFDQSLVVPGLSNLSIRDDDFIKDIQRTLIEIGMFNIADTVGLLKRKVDSTINVHQSLTSLKNRKSASTPKSIDVIEYEVELKDWAIEHYIKDKKKRKLAGESARQRKGEDDSYDIWLFDMAEQDFTYQNETHHGTINESMTEDGTLYGLPERPVSITKYRFSKRFFLECLKNI